MIKFFRKIRQNLLSEGKFTKYLFYAFGEIILVVIGILIALQVNEWNNERNKNRAEEIIIAKLKDDLRKSQIELEETKEYYLIRAKASALILRTFWKNEISTDTVLKYYNLPRSTQIYSPILGTAKSLINSGSIDVLSSSELKNEIVSYVEKVDDKLLNIIRHEESYFRTGAELILEAMPNYFISEELYQKRIEQADLVRLQKSIESGLNTWPLDIDKVPFQADLNELFQNEQFYKGYFNLFVAHEDMYESYDEILVLTNDLLNILNNIELIE